ERADVYSLGATLYHVLAGHPPYSGNSSDEVIKKVSEAPPPSLEELEPGVPKDLAAIVSKAMSRNAADRYPTAKELAEELKRFQTGQLVGPYNYSLATLLRRWLWRHRAPLVVAAALLLVLAVGAVASFRRIVRERNHAQVQQALAEER